MSLSYLIGSEFVPSWGLFKGLKSMFFEIFGEKIAVRKNEQLRRELCQLREKQSQKPKFTEGITVPDMHQDIINFLKDGRGEER